MKFAMYGMGLGSNGTRSVSSWQYCTARRLYVESITGIKMPEETRKKLSVALSVSAARGKDHYMNRPGAKENLRGRKASDEVRKNIREAMKRPEVLEKFTGKNNPMKDPVVKANHIRGLNRPGVQDKRRKWFADKRIADLPRRKMICGEYLQGDLVKDIAEKWDITAVTVYNYLKEFDIKRRQEQHRVR